MKQAFEGICNNIERRYKETQSDASRRELEELMSECPCPDCKGRRLRKESLAVTVGEKNIYEFTTLSVEDALTWMDGLTLTEPFSGTPAIVADRRALGVILPPNFGMQSTENAVSMRLIPFSSLGADGVLPAFRPDAASLSGISIECWVAVTDRTLSAGSFQALVGAAVCDAAQIQG